MPAAPRLTLADLLEKLFDPPANPQVKALLLVALAGLGLWLIYLTDLNELPTRAAASAAARVAAGSDVVVRKSLTLRSALL